MALGVPVTVAFTGLARVVPRAARSRAYNVYRIEVMPLGAPSLAWSVFRRYSEFRSLRDRLAEAGVSVKSAFPRKLGGLLPGTRRQDALNRWLSDLTAQDLRSETVLSFLCRMADAVPHGIDTPQRPSPSRSVPLGGFRTARKARDALRDAYHGLDIDGPAPAIEDMTGLSSSGMPVSLTRSGRGAGARPGPAAPRAVRAAPAAAHGRGLEAPSGLSVDCSLPPALLTRRGSPASSPPMMSRETSAGSTDRSAGDDVSPARSATGFFTTTVSAGGSSTRSNATDALPSGDRSDRTARSELSEGRGSTAPSSPRPDEPHLDDACGIVQHDAGSIRGGGDASSVSSSAARTDSDRLASTRTTSDAGDDTDTPPSTEDDADVTDLGDAPPETVTMDSFDTLKLLGRGGFAKVVMVRHKATRRVYAMKILRKRVVADRKQKEHTRTERSVLGFVKHPFIVGLNFAFQTRDSLYLVLDYCAGGELFFHLQKRRIFDEATTRFYTAQLVVALAYLHERDVVYRDLKPENVLLGADGYIKLADFGLSKEGVASTHGSHSFCGTPEYLAPEIIEKRGHGTAVDWWSLGMLVYEMLTGLPPWYTESRPKLYESLCSADLRFDSGPAARVSPDAQDLIRRLLHRDPAKRLGSGRTGMKDIVEHPFFGDTDYFMALLHKEVPPPICPSLPGGETDASNFEAEFTAAPVASSPPVSSDAGPALCAVPSGASDGMHYAGFTYQRSPDFGPAASPSAPSHCDEGDAEALDFEMESRPIEGAPAPAAGLHRVAAASGAAALVRAARVQSPSSGFAH